MPLSKDAIDTITATAIAASGVPLDTHVPAILVPKGYELVETEHLSARPSRFRGAFEPPRIDAFVHYVKNHNLIGESAGFACDDAGTLTAKVIFDLGITGIPGHGNHIALLEPNRTAPFKAVHKIIDRKLTQQELSEWLEDWAPNIKTIDRDGEAIPLPAAIDAIRRMRIETKGHRESEFGDFNTKKSALEEIEAKSAGRLPGFVHFTCQPYDALDTITIRLRLSVLTGDDEPQFRLRWVNEGLQKEKIVDNFLAVLTDRLEGTVPITIGSFSHE